MPIVTVHFDPEAPQPPPEGANFFHFTQVQDEVEMVVGYVSPTKVHAIVQAHPDAKDQEELPDVSLSPEISHRFLMSLNGFRILRDRVNQIWNTIESRQKGA